MKLIGVRTGEVNGNKYAKGFFEYVPHDPYCGVCVKIEKFRYDFALEVIRDWDKYSGIECDPNFDSFNRVKSFDLI